MFLVSRILVLIFVLIFSTRALSTQENESCSSCFETDIHYLIENHERLYKDNYELFWGLLSKLRNKAFSTDSADELSQFLQLLMLNGYPVEVEEFLSESLENLCVDKPTLFKGAMQRLDSHLSAKINEKLKHPLFREEEELKECLDKI